MASKKYLVRFAWKEMLLSTLVVFIGGSGVGALYHAERCKGLIESSQWRPLRLKMIPLPGDETPEMRRFREKLLPVIEQYWSSVLSVRDVEQETRVARKCVRSLFGLCLEAGPLLMCNQVNVPEELLEGMDLFECPPDAREAGDCLLRESLPRGSTPLVGGDHYFYVTNNDSADHCIRGVLATASSCSSSPCGRMNLGSLNLCSRVWPLSDDVLVNIIVHEIAHSLGFSLGGQTFGWIDEAGNLQEPRKFTIMFEKMGDRLEVIRAPLPFTISSVLTIPYHVVKSISARGFGRGSTCGCPVHPSDQFTNSQLYECLFGNGRRDCVFVVATPKVTEAARSFYDCPTAEGMELENQQPPDSVGRSIFSSHWKKKNLPGELMNDSQWRNMISYISPMTLALFEDSGWYRVDYARGASQLVKGITKGYKDGCDLLEKPCSELLQSHSHLFGIVLHTDGRIVPSICSPDLRDRMRLVSLIPPADIPKQYSYGIGLTSNFASMDYCPVFYPEESLDPANFLITSEGFRIRHASSACSEFFHKIGPPFHREASLGVAVQCDPSASSYEVFEVYPDEYRFAGTCTGLNSEYEFETIVVLCKDPRLVCANIQAPHIPFANIDRRALPTGVRIVV